MRIYTACCQGVQVSSQHQSRGIQCNIDLDTSYLPVIPIATETTPALNSSFEEHDLGEEDSEYVPSSEESDSGDDVNERQVFSAKGYWKHNDS